MTISKSKVILLVVLVLIVAGAMFLGYKMKKEQGYSVVYMTSGEVYVGKLTTFPDFELENAYILQMVKDEKDETKNNFQLQPVKEALWATDSMNLTEENIIFHGELMESSSIAKTLAGEGIE